MKNGNMKTRNRLAGFEIFRILACFGIVCFHLAVPGRKIGYGGLPYFMMLTVYCLMINNNQKTVNQIFRRIMIPWFFWSFVYVMFVITKTSILDENPFKNFHGWMVLTGTSLHLWYLSFSFIIIISLIKIKRFFIKGNPLFWVFICSFISIISSLLGKNMGYLIPVSQYLFIIPSVFIGVYFSKVLKYPFKNLFFKNGFIFLIFSFIFIKALNIDSVSIPYSAAMCGFIIARYAGIPDWKNLNLVSESTFGIYLIHPLIASVLTFAGFVKQSWILLFMTFILSFLIIRIMKMKPLKILSDRNIV